MGGGLRSVGRGIERTGARRPAPPPGATPPARQWAFCRSCGGAVAVAWRDGRFRHACSACSAVDYVNPKLVVGCVVEHEGRILLVRRAIEPCAGRWTVPAGYLEAGETAAEGAARET